MDTEFDLTKVEKLSNVLEEFGITKRWLFEIRKNAVLKMEPHEVELYVGKIFGVSVNVVLSHPGK